MASLKNFIKNPSNSLEIDFLSLSSDSSEAESYAKPSSSKKRPFPAKKKTNKKACFEFSGSFGPEDVHKFWDIE